MWYDGSSGDFVISVTELVEIVYNIQYNKKYK